MEPVARQGRLYIYKYMLVCGLCVYVHMWGCQKSMLGAVLLNHVLRQGFPRTNQQPKESSFFFPQQWGYRSVLLHLAVPGDGELNSGPYVFMARTLQLRHLASQANTGFCVCIDNGELKIRS